MAFANHRSWARPLDDYSTGTPTTTADAPPAPNVPAAGPSSGGVWGGGLRDRLRQIQSHQPGHMPGSLDDINGTFLSLTDLQKFLIGQGGKAGALGPDYLRRALRARALQARAGQQRRSQILAHVLGLDPNQQRVAMVNADIQGGHDLTNSLNEADLAGLSSYQNMIRSFIDQGYSSEDAQRAARWAKQQQDSQHGGWGQFLGQAAGAAAAAFL